MKYKNRRKKLLKKRKRQLSGGKVKAKPLTSKAKPLTSKAKPYAKLGVCKSTYQCFSGILTGHDQWTHKQYSLKPRMIK